MKIIFLSFTLVMSHLFNAHTHRLTVNKIEIGQWAMSYCDSGHATRLLPQFLCCCCFFCFFLLLHSIIYAACIYILDFRTHTDLNRKGNKHTHSHFMHLPQCIIVIVTCSFSLVFYAAIAIRARRIFMTYLFSTLFILSLARAHID